MKYLKPIAEALQLDAQKEMHAIHKVKKSLRASLNYQFIMRMMNE